MSNHYGGSESFTVEHALHIMDDHITAIEDINTNGSLSRFVSIPNTQAATNKAMQIFIDGLEAMLLWDGLDADGSALPPNIRPDVAGDSSDKSSYTDAIATGNTYISNNS